MITHKITTKNSDVLSSSASSQGLNYLKIWRHQPVNQAVTFPAEMYTSDQIYQLEKQMFFGRAWIYVGHISQLSGPGSYFTTSTAAVPLVVVMGSHGNLCAFHNVCPHRAAPVAVGSGQCNRFICPYHAWTFDLEGRLRGIPNFEGYEDFDASNYGLTPVKTETWGPFIFVNLDPNSPPLDVQLNELPAAFAEYNLSDWVRVHSVDYYTDTNWKLYVENNAENYHEPMVHKSSYRRVL